VSATGIILASVLVLAGFWTILGLPPLHPVQLWTVPWAVASALYAVRLLPYRTLSWETLGIAVGATLTFSVAALAAERVKVRPPSQVVNVADSYPVVRRAGVIMVAITAI